MEWPFEIFVSFQIFDLNVSIFIVGMLRKAEPEMKLRLYSKLVIAVKVIYRNKTGNKVSYMEQ